MIKTNIKLFIFLVFLITGTYFYIERPDRLWWSAHDKTYTLKALAENAQVFEIHNMKWILKDGQWVHDADLLSVSTWTKWKKILTSLKLEREIPLTNGLKKENFISQGFTLGLDEEKYIIGDLTLDGKSLYILDIGQQKILQMGLLPSDFFKVLEELKEMSLEKMIEKRIIAYFNEVEFDKVVFETPGILSFELDLIKKITHPAPINGVLTHPQLEQKFYYELELLQFTQQLPYNPGLLYQKMSELIFMDKNKKMLTFELHRTGPQNADAVVFVPDTKQIFKVQGQTAKVFFNQVQDYWDKKIIPRNVFKAFTEIPVNFILGERTALVSVANQEPLGLSSTVGLKQDKLQSLFSIIFNLAHYDEASRVSILSKSERQQFQNELHLRVQVFGQELMLIRKTNELVVVNFTQGFKAHFILFDISIGDQWEDFFTS